MQVVSFVLKQSKVTLFLNLKHWIFQEGSDNEEEEGEEEEEENTDYLTDSNKENETDEENTVCIVALDEWIGFCIIGFLYWILFACAAHNISGKTQQEHSLLFFQIHSRAAFYICKLSLLPSENIYAINFTTMYFHGTMHF